MTTPTKTYRMDYSPDNGNTVIVEKDQTRDGAMKRARSISRSNGSAYAIATGPDGKDTGQRVYYDGRFSHEDDKY